MMKKTLVAIAALAVVSAASAEVKLSGGMALDLSNSTASEEMQLNNGDAAATNLTVTAKENLGGGLTLATQINMRMNAATGAEGGNGGLVQNTNMSLAGAFGSLTLGRWQVASPAGFDAFGRYGNTAYAAAGTASSTRVSNQVGYSSPVFSGFKVSLASSVDGVNNAAREATLARVDYSVGKFAAAYATYDTTAGLNGKDIMASYDFGMAKIMGVQDTSTTGVRNTSVGVRVPYGAFTLIAQAQQGDSDSNTAMGIDYAMSKATTVYAASNSGGAHNQYRFGLRTAF